MTTINQFSDLPSAEAIGVLANELFPDLTEGAYGVPEQRRPDDTCSCIQFIGIGSGGIEQLRKFDAGHR